jgi:hypothetical protein
MSALEAASMAAVWRALRASSPPVVTPRPYDFDDDGTHARRLVRIEQGQRADPFDLSIYIEDVRYGELQRDLLLYLLPVCLQAWHDDLRGVADSGAFVENFYPVLVDRGVFDTLLTPAQTSVVSAFMRRSILDEIDAQRGLSHGPRGRAVYRWVYAVTTYGVVLPDIADLWTPWWRVDTTGRAVAAVQYASVLLYPDDANPVFAAWTRDEGGGPPSLWEFNGHLYTHRWQDANVAFLRRMLTVDAVTDLLERAAAALVGEPEHEAAASVLADVPVRRETLAARCGELPDRLAQSTELNSLRWSGERG